MVELIKATGNDKSYIKVVNNLTLTDNVYIIKDNGISVGVIEYVVDEHYIDIYYIGIDEEYRRRGIASSVIGLISNSFDDTYTISGSAIPSAVPFWLSLSADFGGEDDNIDEYIANNECIGFTI